MMEEFSLKLAKHIEIIRTSVFYENNHIILNFKTDTPSMDIEVSRIISELYMNGDLLKESSCKCKNNTSVFLDDSSIDRVNCQRNNYKLQLNRVRLEYKSGKKKE